MIGCELLIRIGHTYVTMVFLFAQESENLVVTAIEKCRFAKVPERISRSQFHPEVLSGFSKHFFSHFTKIVLTAVRLLQLAPTSVNSLIIVYRKNKTGPFFLCAMRETSSSYSRGE